MSDELLEQLCEAGASFYSRGYAFGSTGNLSTRIGDRIWITPTGQSLKSVTPGGLACIDAELNNYNANKLRRQRRFIWPFIAAVPMSMPSFTCTLGFWKRPKKRRH
jgi:ribulose-5-phosphate 4-epimerase/fuculose-1-phosphate aldolase